MISPKRIPPQEARLVPVTRWLERLPFWLLAFILLGVVFVWVIVASADYQVILSALVQGIVTTVYVSLISYAAALWVGLVVGLMRISSRRAVREVGSFYVEIIRGLPMLVILYYVAFVAAPALVSGINQLGRWLSGSWLTASLGQVLVSLTVREVDFTARAILALTIGYSAFVAEIFRAGIQSIPRGQMEAARSLGMSYWQAMYYVILPQAVRNVLPPLGNDFIAMLKDSSLVSVVGVQDITQLGKVYSANTFRFFETYNVVGFLYLVMTIGLALLVRGLEKRMRRSG